MVLDASQKRFFTDFGYLILPGLMREEAPWITEEFERVFAEAGVVHDGSKRSSLGPFIERSARLCTLLDDPKVTGLLAGLLERILTTWVAAASYTSATACGIRTVMETR